MLPPRSKPADKDGAIAAYKSVLEQKCLFPKEAKEAAEAAEGPGVRDIASVPPALVAEPRQSAAD